MHDIDDIRRFYDRYPEEDRLSAGAFRLEGLRTRRVLERVLPPPPATVVDIGGGAGAYASWLEDRGYTVYLLDAVPRLVRLAADDRGPHGRRLAAAVVGDARALPFRERSADVALLLGPLYHLVDESDRGRALEQARRVLRPGGRLVAAAISRFGSAVDALVHELYLDDRFRGILDEDPRTGVHRNPTDEIGFFTSAYFHRPDELRSEVERAGFRVEALIGLEGPAALLPDLDARLDDPVRGGRLLSLLERIESEPDLLGVSPHVLAVGRTAD